MATIVLSAVGSAFGGPIGLALGSLIGREIDSAVFGIGSRKGPRLKELAVTTSSYGQPIPRNFGRLRVAGTVIWATDLVESSSKEGGKGQPKTTTYSYSVSFAVALSSTPIARLGRIWADGNLLRGVNEDLKVAGTLRTYLGTGDNPVDPVIAADKGAQAPAFRDCAYVVFEDLQLADYGNRIPALTFEIFSETDQQVTLGQIVPQAQNAAGSAPIDHARGFADEGGPVGSSLAAIDQVMPVYCVNTGDGFTLSSAAVSEGEISVLPPQLVSTQDGEADERTQQRADNAELTPLAVRYYDEQRDYQPGVQRAVGSRPNGRENMIDLPATMMADGARQLANENAQRARWHHEKITWRVAELNPSIQPGSLVRVPDSPGLWIVKGWEWFDRGIELTLERAPPAAGTPLPSEAGQLISPVDLPIFPTSLQFLELPSDGTADSSAPQLFAAASSENNAWRGAALFAEQGSTLVQIGSTETRRAVTGVLVSALPASEAILFEPRGSMTIKLVADDLVLESTDVTGLAAGFNRLLVGGEVVQFADAEYLGERVWQLSGLLRGRAGTEARAAMVHESGTSITLLDDRLTALDAGQLPAGVTSRIAAIGRGDQEPVYATLQNTGVSRRPLVPVHPRILIDGSSNWTLCWTRRARGQWLWEDRVEVPLVEELESYLLGFGPESSPFQTWVTDKPEISFSPSERTDLTGLYGSGSVWVKQIGTFDQSDALFIAEFS
ncbi:phage tail protein [uncultured Erythrobacter sp.]|uniref:GTA baseplate fiber-binding domain-containing protein n=1 Tax=uncultured Erythrobacter sp. TaxID=263913 RepID=UPI0026236F3F|nr:phage tail protein [uncultured Erythrobacter sp.]